MSMTRRVFSLILIVIGLSILNQSYAQVMSYPVDSELIDPTSDGFIYSLPKHTLKIEVEVKKIERFKGKFSDYATKLLGITDFISKDGTSYELGQIKISAITEIDSNQMYYAQFPSKMKENTSFFIRLTEEGYISDFHVQKQQILKSNSGKSTDQPFRELLKPVLIEKVDTIIRRVSIDTSVFEEKLLKRSISEKSNEQQAKEIADLIYKIEDSKFNIISGYQEVNYSKESIQLMLEKLNSIEKDYISFFKGSEIESHDFYTFYYTPEQKPSESLVTLFRFSSSEGLFEKNRQYGDEITLTIHPENMLKEARVLESKRTSAKRKGQGLFYRIPESVIVSVQMGNRILANEKTLISQMGFLTFLPYNNLSSAEFNQNGSLKTLILEK